MAHDDHDNRPVTTALLLAAGTGSRLYPLTKKAPKCLTMVNGISMLERLASCLNHYGFKRLIVVTGHLENSIRVFLGTRFGGMKVDYVFSPLFAVTNNIYSLWMARNIIDEPFLLLESDLVFDRSLLEDMLCSDRIAVSSMQPWMNGSTVTINRSQHVKKFRNDGDGPCDEAEYKTVNIYSLSLSSWRRIRKRLNQYISAGRVDNYYEAVFAEMIADGSLSLKAVFFDNKPWYEIDTIADLVNAEKLFSAHRYRTGSYYRRRPRTTGKAVRFLQNTEKGKVVKPVNSQSGLMLPPSIDSLRKRPRRKLPESSFDPGDDKGCGRRGQI